MTAPLILIWEFRPRPGREAEFLGAYGPGGAWTALFARGEGWLGTELARDTTDPARYVTIDRWTSCDAYDTFREKFAAEHAALDVACEAFTVHERRIGAFEHSAAGPPAA